MVGGRARASGQRGRLRLFRAPSGLSSTLAFCPVGLVDPRRPTWVPEAPRPYRTLLISFLYFSSLSGVVKSS